MKKHSKPTTSAKRRLTFEDSDSSDADGTEPLKKRALKKKKVGTIINREQLARPDFFQAGSNSKLKIMLPMPKTRSKRAFMGREFVLKKCVLANQLGVYTSKWAPEVELSTGNKNASDQKILQAKFQIFMTTGAHADEYKNGSFPVKTTVSLRRGLEKRGNQSILEMDSDTFQLFLEEGMKLCDFVERELRGKTFDGLSGLKLPEIVCLNTGRGFDGGPIHTLLILSIFKWGRSGCRVQPFFNIRNFAENPGDKLLIPTAQGVTLNYREFHNLVFPGAEYLGIAEEQLAKPKVVHDKIQKIMEQKIEAFITQHPDVDTESLAFIYDDGADSKADDDDDDGEGAREDEESLNPAQYSIAEDFKETACDAVHTPSNAVTLEPEEIDFL